ncbi:FKBP-type peptidyl-prolyl cis-trans isomerase [Candidatus Saccharibacteria bacterium]|nr:FKBP-type peptidyl-prolyl cis-trans isomerase [Candidatus Saccharibacteria bacterium]
MEEKALKTSWKQRIVIGLIAVLLLGSTIAIYAFTVLGNEVDYSKMTQTQLETAYEQTYSEYEAEVSALSSQYYNEFVAYKTNVKAYNTTTANSGGVVMKDLKEGTGADLPENYSAYYIGWCADETIFDSSFDNYEEPTSLKAPLAVTPDSLIDGWYTGTEGMKLGGIREITIPGPLAYGDTQEICGGKNTPLKFIVLAIETNSKLEELSKKLNNIYLALSDVYTQNYSNYSAPDVTGSDSSENNIEISPEE